VLAAAALTARGPSSVVGCWRRQVYIKEINVMLAILTLFLVVTFHSSAHLTASYGAMVTSTFLLTTVR
jgi:K+ transporter